MQNEEALFGLPSGWTDVVLRDEHGCFLRSGTVVGHWRNVEPIAMNSRSIALLRDGHAVILSCVANDEADAVHTVALSPHGTWLAVALRSGKILRFERGDHAAE